MLTPFLCRIYESQKRGTTPLKISKILDILQSGSEKNVNPPRGFLYFKASHRHCQGLCLNYVREHSGQTGGEGVREIEDDPIVRCMERNGCPPWLLRGGTDHEERDEDRGGDDNAEL